MTTKTRGEVLLKAHDLINKEKRTVYGDPEDSFAQIGAAWTLYLRTKYKMAPDISRLDVSMMMLLLKIIRAANGYKDDTYLDAAGYIGIAQDMAIAEQQEKPKTISELYAGEGWVNSIDLRPRNCEICDE